MRRVKLSARAQRDLNSILAFIAEDSPTKAVKMVDRLERASFEPAETALHYPLLPSQEDTCVRRRVVHPYNIFFSVEGDTVEVLHILHGARNIGRILFPEG